MSLTYNIKNICFDALNNIIGEQTDISIEDVKVTVATQKSFGHYQCNAALSLAKRLKCPPREIAQKVSAEIFRISNSNDNLSFEKVEVAGPGFINLSLSAETLSKNLLAISNSNKFGVKQKINNNNVVIDYSSPNVAKEMHVGHLRSTIIGESIARILEFNGYNVSRVNHIGDWGTQFGMLIAYFEAQDITNFELTLSELVDFYRKAKEKFDNDEDFKEKAKHAVVRLQAKEDKAYSIWLKICDISQIGYDEIYNMLGIEGLEVKGESFYNPYLKEMIELLESKNMIEISDGAKCIYQEGFKNRDGDPLPLIVQKSDGGFNYATTDLAAIKYRAENNNANLIIYVVDAGQSLHFDMVFSAAKKAGIIDSQNTEPKHVPFGLVLREDGKKFKTRSGDTEKLIDLLNTAISKSKDILKNRAPDMSEEDLDIQAKKLGINAVKYADLSCNRTSNYKFSYEKMLQFEGNTAAFVNYAYVRAKSIIRKCGTDLEKVEDISPNLVEESEKDLSFHLALFSDTLEQAANDLMPNRIAEYVFQLSELFHSFFHHCRVQGSDYEKDRLFLCAKVAETIKESLLLLGLSPLERM